MQAHIITIGNELLIGQVIDTNSAYMASQLTALNFKVDQIISVSDTEKAISKAIKTSLAEAQLIVISGGLGPTRDDITKTTLCKLFDTNLVFSEEVFANVQFFLEKRKVPLNELNRQQALVPANAKILTNRFGTAPGLWFEQNGKVVVCLPGVPFEMKGIFEQELIPQLKVHFNLPALLFKTYLLTGIAESILAERIADWEDQLPQNATLAYLPSPGLIRLRVGLSGNDHVLLEKQLKELEKGLMPLIEEFLFGYNNDTMASVIGQLLVKNKNTMAVAESCTGGNIAHLITLTPGSSDWFAGGVVSYSNQVKSDVLYVDEKLISQFGAVSSEVAKAMAIGVRKATGADFSVSTTGIAGPDGGLPEKPVGTVWIAVSYDEKVIARKFNFGSEREINIARFSMAAMNFLRTELVIKLK